MQLVNRQKLIPNGYFFYEPLTKWKSPYGSFSQVQQAIIAHRQANPWLRKPIDPNIVANELDQFAANWCNQMGWTDYIIGGDPPVPPQQPPPSLASRLVNVAAGAENLVEWIASGAEAVPQEVANSRAKTCTDIDGQGNPCPKNEHGDWLRWFTVPVSNAIRKELIKRKEMKLETPYDDKLGVCGACSCPMKLKVHVPIERARRLRPEVMNDLHPQCWIKNEK